MKILYLRPYPGEEQIVIDSLSGHEVIFADSLEEVTATDITSAEAVSVFVDIELRQDFLEQMSNLKLIATRSAGFDHVDVGFAKDKGITVCRVPHYGTRTVAEFAFALMFALSRNAFRAYSDIRESADIDDLSTYEGFDLCGKTLGVIGTGAIGENVCQIALGLGMSVLATDPVEKDSLKKLSVKYVSLDELLQQSDIVTLHVPAMEETQHLLNEDKLSLMKNSAYLINTSRGEVVDTRALVKVLREKGLAGAGLDVLEGEKHLRDEMDLLLDTDVSLDEWRTLIADHTLIDMSNVIVTPHIAFNTKEAKHEITVITLDNIKRFTSGSLPEANRVHD
ncbi:hydroxyacid dehydrogenase [bacterium]|nr:hydroxyacid dehydrogenase [bacterium]